MDNRRTRAVCGRSRFNRASPELVPSLARGRSGVDGGHFGCADCLCRRRRRRIFDIVGSILPRRGRCPRSGRRGYVAAHLASGRNCLTTDIAAAAYPSTTSRNKSGTVPLPLRGRISPPLFAVALRCDLRSAAAGNAAHRLGGRLGRRGGLFGALGAAAQAREAAQAAPEAALLRLRVGLQVAAELLGAGAPRRTARRRRAPRRGRARGRRARPPSGPCSGRARPRRRRNPG